MQYHLVLTQKCNLNCTYCGSTVNPEIMPVNIEYSIADLQQFLSNLNEPPVIAFYGGEPTISYKKIIEIIDFIPAKAFVLQTNGTLLHKIPINYYPKFHSILISVDGRPETTNFKRGRGIQERAIAGANRLRQHGFDGDLIARMTMTTDSNVYEDVTYLLEHREPVFDHVHWQLDVMWDTFFEEKQDRITEWLLERYNPGISRLINYWHKKIVHEHELPGIAPFLGIMHTLLSSQDTGLRCGAGNDFFSITTDGRVTVCPILPSTSFANVGNIYNIKPNQLQNIIQLDPPCTECGVQTICGGRCIYTNKTKFWGDDGFDLVCQTVKHLIKELRQIQPKIQHLIDDGIFTIGDFKYPNVENGVEIIP